LTSAPAPTSRPLIVALVCGAVMLLVELLQLSLARTTFRWQPALLPLALPYLLLPAGAALVGGLLDRRAAPPGSSPWAWRLLEGYLVLAAACGLALQAFFEVSILPEGGRRAVLLATLLLVPAACSLAASRWQRLRTPLPRLITWTLLYGLAVAGNRLPRNFLLAVWNHQHATAAWLIGRTVLLVALAGLLGLGMRAAVRRPGRAGLLFLGGLAGLAWLTTPAAPHRALPRPTKAGATAPATTTGTPPVPGTRSPAGDIFLVILDSLRFDATSLSPHAPGSTPRLEALAQRGTSFVQASSPSTMTEFSLPLLTGLPPGDAPLLRVRSAQGARRWRDSLPGQLQAAGYRVHLLSDYQYTTLQGLDVGRWDTVALAPDRWLRLPALPGALAAIAAGREDELPARLGDKLPFGPGGPAGRLAELLATERAPGFYLIHLAVPHAPFNLPPYQARSLPPWPAAEQQELVRRFEKLSAPPTPELTARFRQLYLLAVRAADEQVAALDAAIARAGRPAQSLLVVTADHGEPFGEHGIFGHGRTLHLEGHQVPLVAVGPGFPAGRTIQAPVSNGDLPATLLGWAGLPTTEPRLDRVAREEQPALPVLVWHPRGLRLQQDSWALIWTSEAYLLTRPAAWAHRREVELYDLRTDPAERRDLFPGPPGVAARLFAEVLRSPRLPEQTRQRLRARLPLLELP